jgi:hypothetical protein
MTESLVLIKDSKLKVKLLEREGNKRLKMIRLLQFVW